jgi:hypothetical protein
MYFECEADYNAYRQAEADAQGQYESEQAEYEHLQSLIEDGEYEVYAFHFCSNALWRHHPEAAKFLILLRDKLINAKQKAIEQQRIARENKEANQANDDLPF